ncbi:hypothetical protein Tco_0992488, partial [Tanacetum coccineum]
PVSGKLSDTPGAFESSKDVPDNDTVVDEVDETQTLSEINDFEPNAKKNRPDDDADNVEEPGNENKETNEAGSVVEEEEEEDVTYLIMKMKHKVMNGTIITNTNVTY